MPFDNRRTYLGTKIRQEKLLLTTCVTPISRGPKVPNYVTLDEAAQQLKVKESEILAAHAPLGLERIAQLRTVTRAFHLIHQPCCSARWLPRRSSIAEAVVLESRDTSPARAKPAAPPFQGFYSQFTQNPAAALS
jgi:hypothetical protein